MGGEYFHFKKGLRNKGCTYAYKWIPDVSESKYFGIWVIINSNFLADIKNEVFNDTDSSE